MILKKLKAKYLKNEDLLQKQLLAWSEFNKIKFIGLKNNIAVFSELKETAFTDGQLDMYLELVAEAFKNQFKKKITYKNKTLFFPEEASFLEYVRTQQTR